MPLILGCFALAMPRVVLVIVYLTTHLIESAYATLLWPALGLIFAPLTTLAYAFAHQRSQGNVTGFWLAFVIVALLIDIGIIGRSRGKKKSRED